MTPLMSQAEFVAKVERANPSYEVLSEYRGARRPILRKCKVCNDEREVKARSLTEGRKCIVCIARAKAKTLRKTHSRFLDEMRFINADIEILSEYVTNNVKVQCHCLKCDNIWKTTPGILLGGSGCPVCARANNEIASRHRMSHDEYVAAITEKFPNIIVLSEFTKMSQRVSYVCKTCNYDWDAVANTLLNCSTIGCPNCAGKGRISEQRFLERLNTMCDDIEYIGEYTGMARHARFRCAACSHEWSASPANILSGKGCPRCKESKGAKAVARYLDCHNVFYIREHRFNNCVDERPLPFDFYLPQLRVAIEYDGEQHFGPVMFGRYNLDAAIEKFEYTQKHDAIKDKYCSVNNITLIRIPYTDFDKIDEILDKLIS